MPGSTGNVAGLLQFCIQNNYLGGASGGASSVKDALMGKLGGNASSDSGYTSGASGVLDAGNGSKLDLSGGGLKQQVTKQICDKVLTQAKSLLWCCGAWRRRGRCDAYRFRRPFRPPAHIIDEKTSMRRRAAALSRPARMDSVGQPLVGERLAAVFVDPLHEFRPIVEIVGIDDFLDRVAGP